jgi:hypothetical protein
MMGSRVIARCAGCQGEIVLAQEDAESTAHLSGPEYATFLREHEPCRAKVKAGPFITKRME